MEKHYQLLSTLFLLALFVVASEWWIITSLIYFTCQSEAGNACTLLETYAPVRYLGLDSWLYVVAGTLPIAWLLLLLSKKLTRIDTLIGLVSVQILLLITVALVEFVQKAL